MNKKWFTGIGFAFLMILGALIYTTTSQARNSSKADKNLENLTRCAEEKNPGYLAHVLDGALAAYDKDVKKAIKDDKVGELKKPREALVHVVGFLFKDSKHFSPMYKHEEHQPKFVKALDKEIQKRYHQEYKAASKDKKMQGALTKEYRDVVRAFEQDGVKGLSKIVSPEKADKKKKKAERKAKKAKKGGFMDKMKKAGHDAAKKAKKAAKKAKKAVESAVSGGDADAAEGDDAPAEEEAPADDEEEEGGEGDSDADAEEEDAGDEEEEADEDDSDADAEEEDAGDEEEEEEEDE